MELPRWTITRNLRVIVARQSLGAELSWRAAAAVRRRPWNRKARPRSPAHCSFERQEAPHKKKGLLASEQTRVGLRPDLAKQDNQSGSLINQHQPN